MLHINDKNGLSIMRTIAYPRHQKLFDTVFFSVPHPAFCKAFTFLHLLTGSQPQLNINGVLEFFNLALLSAASRSRLRFLFTDKFERRL